MTVSNSQRTMPGGDRASGDSGERLRAAAEAAGFGVYQYDFTTGEAYHSPDCLALHGLPQGAILELDCDMIPKVLHPDDRARFLARMQAANDPHGSGAFDAEYRILLPDGQLRWLRRRGRTVFTGRGPESRPLRSEGIILDVTRVKQAEQEIAEQRNQLAHISRVGMMNELSGAVAHEMNQPLAAILASAHAALAFLAEEPADLSTLREILSDIVAADKRAGEVIHRMRALLRSGALHREPLDVNNIVREVLELVHNDLILQGITAQTELAPDLPNIQGERVQLQQVLLNLVLNARDAMVHTAQEERQLTIRTIRVGDDSVQISVIDRGVGISQEQIERIFEPFYTTKASGLGLGLAVSRSIVLAHGGRLWATGNPERGATFQLTLPASKESREGVQGSSREH